MKVLPLSSAALLLVLLLAAPALAQKEGEVDRVAPTADAPRGQVLEWMSAEEKPYWYRLPSTKAKAKPNLVFMLHGTGLRWGWAFWNYPIGSGNFRGNDIVIAPEGMTKGNGETFNFVQGKRDGDQIAGLIREFREQFDIDKVYVYGHSQGAFFAYWFAGAYTELVDGIVAHAGNVLDVNHNELAKKKVAIGILHGEADAVVPVSTAYRTEKIYKDRGYQKVKLYVVEGLTERSGHWPLPKQAAEMFDWLDQVSADRPELTIQIAREELAKDAPDLTTLVDAIERTLELVRRLPKKQREPFRSDVDEFDATLERLVSAHSDAIDAAEDSESAQPAWEAHFQIVHSVFRKNRAWNKAQKKRIRAATKQDRGVRSLLGAFEKNPNPKTAKAALAAFEHAPLALGCKDLARALSRWKDSAKGLDGAIASEIEQAVSEFDSRIKAARAALERVTKSAIEAAETSGEAPNE